MIYRYDMSAQIPISRLTDNTKKRFFSVEFFPPKTEEAAISMMKAAEEIQKLDPAFVTITYGAGGTTRLRTLDYATRLKDEFGFQVMPHLTCVGHSKNEICKLLEDLSSRGFCNIMALRGDPPKGEKNFTPHPDGFHYANELVEFIKSDFPEFSLGVAGYPDKHPEASTIEADINNLAKKIQAGGDFVTTQLFYDNSVFHSFITKCRAHGITEPIIPGILPILSLAQINRFCEMSGSSLPENLIQRLKAAEDDKQVDVGVEWAFEQTKDLMNVTHGVHLYVLNRSSSTIKLVKKLRDAAIL
jgi:methylenetetrahydrofolate reductase (NADPH)